MTDSLTAYITGGAWEVYAYTLPPNQRVIVSFNVNRALEVEHPDLPHCARLLIYAPAQFTDAQGLPDGDLWQPLGELEDKIMEILAKHQIACQFVGRLTYTAVRELIFQVDPAHLPHFHEITDEIIHRSPLEMSRKEEAGWRFFDQNIRPTPPMWQQIHNRHQLEQLEAQGFNLEAPHQLQHQFRGNPLQLQAIAQQLSQDGFTVLSQNGNELRLGLHHPQLDLDELTALTTSLHTYTAVQGATYEGWSVDKL
jgi:hypothetical protein